MGDTGSTHIAAHPGSRRNPISRQCPFSPGVACWTAQTLQSFYPDKCGMGGKNKAWQKTRVSVALFKMASGCPTTSLLACVKPDGHTHRNAVREVSSFFCGKMHSKRIHQNQPGHRYTHISDPTVCWQWCFFLKHTNCYYCIWKLLKLLTFPVIRFLFLRLVAKWNSINWRRQVPETRKTNR